MNKGLIILSALALSACTIGHDTDMDRAAARRELNIMQRHQATGCTFLHEHEDYKNCLLNTYNVNHPATYSTTTMQDGRSVAIVRPNAQAGAQSPCGLAPLPAKQEYEWAAPTTVSQTKSVETVCQKKFEPQQTIVQTVEETIPPPEPEVIFVQQEQPVLEEQEEPAVQWGAPVPAEPVCPCADPNDPCPQCYDK